jgi:hypothetical protein
MRIIAERLDYMCFLGCGLDDEIPNHSMLSKARAHWDVDVFVKRASTERAVGGATVDINKANGQVLIEDELTATNGLVEDLWVPEFEIVHKGVGGSAQTEDFKPHNRLYVAKEEIKKFINRRINDRIGLVVFARYAYTQCPLTTDYGVLLKFVDQVNFGTVEDGTAIGMGYGGGLILDAESGMDALAHHRVYNRLVDRDLYGQLDAGDRRELAEYSQSHTTGGRGSPVRTGWCADAFGSGACEQCGRSSLL